MTKKQQSGWLFIGAIGVVFGDIGTSPLYALQSIFHLSGLPLDTKAIQGIISLILWSIVIIVSIKYIGLLMRVDNRGEGGIMALVGLLRKRHFSKKQLTFLTLAGFIGISLFYGDGVITPAISVLSAVEGISLISPAASSFVIPIALIILGGLFLLQHKGTSSIGKLFGPIMIVWFSVSAIGGLTQIIEHPAILTALLPSAAIQFVALYPLQAFIAMGAVILAVTGAEALYADMGHFGRKPIQRAWFFVIFPALTLTYLGQGALISAHPEAVSSAYYLMFPVWSHIPVIILATVATLIASQAVISGVFSLTWQAMRLGFLPRLTIEHTSRYAFGQIYIPLLNWTMFSLVVAIIIGFGSSKDLAAMFGIAVAGTLIVDSIFLLIVMRSLWRKPLFVVGLSAFLILGLELLFFAAGISKLLHGAWVVVIIAVIGFTIMSTWYKGHQIIRRERSEQEGSLTDFVEKLHRSKVPRVKGYAVYLGHHEGNAPMALHATLEQLHEIHEKVVVVTVKTTDDAHVPEKSRLVIDDLGDISDGISHLTLRFGYKDIPNVPRALELARTKSSEIGFDPYDATYFTSVSQPLIIHNKRMAMWRKKLYLYLDRNADNHSQYFKLPIDRTIEMRAFLEL